MESIWYILNQLLSIEFTLYGYTITFWQLNVGLILVALVVGFLYNLFD